MKKNQYSFYIILFVEILTVTLTSIGIFPREAILFMTGLMVFYFIFSRIEDSLILFIISIPLFVALPIAGYDSMANWRILLTVLFFVWLAQRKWLKVAFRLVFNKVFFKKPLISSIAKLTVLFLVIGVLSLAVATDIVVGIKKLLFLINIFLLFIIVKDVARDKEMRLKIIKAGAIAGITSLVIGYTQLVSVFFTPLYSFWQWWAKNIISVFYGFDLAKLLAVSNTWFSYYPDSPPTLRMFSIFPDSHSFALFTIISLIFFSYLLLKTSKKIYWLPIIFSFLALVFSGSRGIWVSAILPFGLIIIFSICKLFKEKKCSRLIHLNSHFIHIFISFLLIFLIAFPVSSFLMSRFSSGPDGTLAFKRAKSVTDLEELSVRSRMEIWKNSFESVIKHPLLGVGIGNYPVVLGEDVSAGKKGASAHNLYLDVASEMGLLGLIVLLLIFLEIFKKALRFVKEPHNQIFSQIFAFFFLWLLVYNLFDVVLLNDKVLLLFMIPLGLLYSKEL